MRTLETKWRKPDTEQINFLATPELAEAIEEKARDADMSKSDWCRKMLAKAAGRPELSRMPRRPGVAMKRQNGHNGSKN